MHQRLEKIVRESLSQIDEVAGNDPENSSKHLSNVLEAVKKVYDHSYAYRSALEELYEKDPYMNHAKGAIADIVHMMCSRLPQVKWCFEEDRTNKDFMDYSFDVQDAVVDVLVDRYPNFIACNEERELMLIGMSEVIDSQTIY